MKNILWILLLGTLLPLWGQNNSQWFETVRQLKQDIQLLTRLAEQYHAQKMMQALQKAQEELDKAVNYFQHFQFDQARRSIQKALTIVRQVKRQLAKVPSVKWLLELQQRLKKVERRLNQQNNQQALYFYDKAQYFLEKAVQAFQMGDVVKGQEYQRVTAYFADKAEFFLFGEQQPLSSARINEHYDQLTHFYAELKQQVGDQAQVKEILRKIERFLRQAHLLIQQAQVKKALIQLQIAERLLYRAMDMGESGKGQGKWVQENLRSLELFINGIEQQIGKNNNAQRLLNKARRYLALARNAYQRGRYDKAKKQLLLAQRIATRSLKYVQGDFNETMTIRLEEVRNLWQVYQKQHTVKLAFQQIIDNWLNRGEKACQQNHTRVCTFYLNLVLRLLNQHQQQDYTPAQIQQLEQKLTRFEKALSRGKLNSQTEPLYPVFRQTLRQARKAFENKDYALCQRMLSALYAQWSRWFKKSTP